jgi:hypothetical protein
MTHRANVTEPLFSSFLRVFENLDSGDMPSSSYSVSSSDVNVRGDCEHDQREHGTAALIAPHFKHEATNECCDRISVGFDPSYKKML